MTFRTPTTSLEQLKQQLDKGQEIVVDDQGTLHLPDEAAVQKAQAEGQATTKLKPQRWF